ncbi:sodium-dependent glucose transporter 1 isoform X2 [Chanos chanos]|uniref:Sodium-dependent glucose transporter 1 isoform X2 n=1 Tax=Chanos chanos TaxID=29144 RepID=A0A6J2V4Y8_CHACN|nr:sodium-dependent glucose transporter 1 isoform X2 [Chanos chanos]
MSVSVTGEPVVKKKQVRFARLEEDEVNEDQEEDTLFDKRKDTRGALRSAIKGGRILDEESDKVEIKSRGRNTSDSGVFTRWIITLSLCASFLGLGMSISVLGPTLEDLARNVNENISNISHVFVGRSSGYMGGSVLGGILFDFANPHLLLGFSMLCTAFGMFAIPFCKKAVLLTVLMATVGVSMGFLDTGGNVLILNTWGDQSGPYMQALHFCFAAGAFVSPIIAKLLFGHSHELSENPSTDQESKPLHLQLAKSKGGFLKSMWAYIVIGVFLVLISLSFFILYIRSSPARKKSNNQLGKPKVARYHKTLIFLLSLFFFWYVGAEVAYGSFIFTYAKDFAKMPQPQAAGLNALFWGTFAATRGLAIFFAACLYPGMLIILSLVGCTISSVLLVLFSKHQIALWSCTALYGVSMATTFPSGVSWVEQYTTVTGSSAAAFVVGAALGEMVLPALVGFLLGKLPDYPVLMFLCLTTSVVTFILFPIMYKLATFPSGPSGKPHIRGLRRESDDSEYQQALLDTGGNEDEGEQNEDDEGADQWNDADFEVIEMDDASLSSPNKAFSQPDVAVSASPTETTGLASLPDSSVSAQGDSPEQQQLLALDREKKD